MEKYYPLDDTDDQITVIDGPDYSWHDHVSPIFIMPLRYPLSKKLRDCYENYYKNLITDH